MKKDYNFDEKQDTQNDGSKKIGFLWRKIETFVGFEKTKKGIERI